MVTDTIYLGAKFQYDLGTSILSSWLLGIEGGYNVSVADKIVIRPELGLGLAGVSATAPKVTVFGTTVGGGSVSTTDLYIAPAGTLLYDIQPDIFLGLHIGIPIILTSGSTTAGLLFLATGGMRF